MRTCPIAFGRHGHNSHVRVSATRVSLKVWTVQSAGSPMAMGNQREYPNANFARARRPVRLSWPSPAGRMLDCSAVGERTPTTNEEV